MGELTPVPVVLDCDPGHDDMFAILLAAAHPAIDLLAVTTVAGNGTLEAVTLNARKICTAAGLHDMIIAAGADRALNGAQGTAPEIHGESALDGTDLPEPTVPLADDDAVTVMARLLRESPRPVTIAPTGPLTNIATLLDRHPEVKPKIERIVFMGGTTGRGNRHPLAEFNIWADPEAADLVLRSGLPLLMCGLDVTHQAVAGPEVFDRLRAVEGTLPAVLAASLAFYGTTYREIFGMPGPPLHDPVAIAAIAEPEIVRCVEASVVVELIGEHTRGATVVDLYKVTGRPANVQVALELDRERFWDLILDAVAALAGGDG
ncbi:nucleoside hydrolase [Thermopolyspora sp. NPDC052614]|uniref:nucleoside hydrolase n=1 Tax=Thermopolyspora sp. NPDC052614 TaxID=3155682 RepID=UPI00342B71EE